MFDVTLRTPHLIVIFDVRCKVTGGRVIERILRNQLTLAPRVNYVVQCIKLLQTIKLVIIIFMEQTLARGRYAMALLMLTQ